MAVNDRSVEGSLTANVAASAQLRARSRVEITNTDLGYPLRATVTPGASSPVPAAGDGVSYYVGPGATRVVDLPDPELGGVVTVGLIAPGSIALYVLTSL